MRVIWLGAMKDNLKEHFEWNNDKKSNVEDGFTNWGLDQVRLVNRHFASYKTFPSCSLIIGETMKIV